MRKILSLFMAGGIALGLAACLNDEEHFIDFAGTSPVIDIPSSAFFGVVANQGLSIQTAPVSYSFNVNLSGPQTLSEDVTVTLAVDPAVLAQYNAANNTRFQALPTSLYQFATTTTTIKAGQRLAPVTVNFFSGADKITDQVAYNNANYALPIRITTTSNNVAVSSNYGYKIVSLKLRNQYDGTYAATGRFTHPTLGGRAINETKELQTIDLNMYRPTLPIWEGPVG